MIELVGVAGCALLRAWAETSEAVVIAREAFVVVFEEPTGTIFNSGSQLRDKVLLTFERFSFTNVAGFATAASWSTTSPASWVTVEANPFKFELVEIAFREDGTHSQKEKNETFQTGH